MSMVGRCRTASGHVAGFGWVRKHPTASNGERGSVRGVRLIAPDCIAGQKQLPKLYRF